MEEIKSIKVKLDTIGNNIKLVAISDVHLGDSNCDVEKFRGVVNFIKNTPDCYCVLLGDILNTALKNSKSDIYTETLNVAQAQKLALEILTPIKDKILAMTPGNHENRVWREVGVDVSLWLAERLGIQDKYRNNAVALSVQFGKDINGNPFRINIFGQHGGYGGGRKLGAAMNALEDMDGMVANADIFLRAHTHSPVSGRRDVFLFNEQGNAVRKSKYYFNAPSFLNFGGYAEEKGYRPQNTDPKYLNIRALSTRVGTVIQKNFKVDEIIL